MARSPVAEPRPRGGPDGAGVLPGRAPAPRDPRLVDARARARRRRAARAVRARPVRDALRVRQGRGADLGQRRLPARPHDPRGRRRQRRARATRRRGDVVGVRGPFGTAWPVEAAEGADVVVLTGGIGLAPLRPVVAPPARATASATAASSCSTAAARPRSCSTPPSSSAGAGASTSRCTSPSTRRRPAGTGASASSRRSCRVPTSTRPHGGDDLRARGDDALRGRRAAGAGRAGGGDLRVARAQHEVRDPAVRPLPARARVHLPRRPGVPAGTASSRCCGCGSSRWRDRPKLAVWKFASCDGCQLSVLDCEDELLALAGEVDLAYFLEASSAPVGGPVRPLARRGLDHHAGGRRAHPARAAAVAPRRHDRRLRHRGRDPGAAQLRRRRGLPRRRLRVARVRLDARHLDGDLRARPRRLRAARLPDRQAPAARGHQRVPQRAPARDRVAQRVRRVQARAATSA